MQQLVDLGGLPFAARRQFRVRLQPERLERVVFGAAAGRAGPVPGRERRRLVEEEQLRVLPGRHHRPVPVLELERQVTQGVRAQAFVTRRCPSCRQPRLPMNSPRSGVATISPHGVTRFCNGIVSSPSFPGPR
jgi:hypothetical protein